MADVAEEVQTGWTRRTGAQESRTGGLGGRGPKKHGRADGGMGGLADERTRGWAGGLKRHAYLLPISLSRTRSTCLMGERISRVLITFSFRARHNFAVHAWIVVALF